MMMTCGHTQVMRTNSLTRLMHPLTHPPAHLAHTLAHSPIGRRVARRAGDAQLGPGTTLRARARSPRRQRGRKVAWLARTYKRSPGHHHLVVNTNAIVMPPTIGKQQHDWSAALATTICL
jgi:hypothetical protein